MIACKFHIVLIITFWQTPTIKNNARWKLQLLSSENTNMEFLLDSGPTKMKPLNPPLLYIHLFTDCNNAANDASCDMWIDQCTTNVDFMKKKCARACGFCKSMAGMRHIYEKILVNNTGNECRIYHVGFLGRSIMRGSKS